MATDTPLDIAHRLSKITGLAKTLRERHVNLPDGVPEGVAPSQHSPALSPAHKPISKG